MQRSFDDAGAPLSEVTFAVIDLETTGGSPGHCAITEVGAVKLRGGECLGRLQTLVNPGVTIPPAVTYLTGITEAMVLPAPRMGAVLPSLLEFVGDAVLVGHNVRFDLAFLNAALEAERRPRLSNPAVDTAALARRLVRDEVRDCKLSTLAEHFRLEVRPTHRALDDAEATGELLHRLLERAGTIGVLALGDLLELPRLAAHPQASKLRLTTRLPTRAGVYMFKDATGRVIYVGKAADLRRRVRSYFGGDDRRKVSPMLRQLRSIEHQVCSGELEAAVREIRLIHAFTPRFNRRSRDWRRYAYLKLTLDERFPRLAVGREADTDDGCVYVGPLSSTSHARLVADAVRAVVPIRRCSTRIGARARTVSCPAGRTGGIPCPCDGSISAADYLDLVQLVAEGLTREPGVLLEPLERRMADMARSQRYEEAAAIRVQVAALAGALARQQRYDALRRAGRTWVEVDGEGGGVIDGGLLITAWGEDGPPATDPQLRPPRLQPSRQGSDPPVPPRHQADELLAVASWIDARWGRLRVLGSERGLAWPVEPLPRFEPATSG